MGKMHELLAVESELEGAYKATVDEGTNTCTKKAELFQGHERTYRAFADADNESFAPERKEMTTTVHEKLNYIWGHAIKYLDAVLQKEATNQDARADLIVEGQTLATGVPATFLLGLESKLKAWKELLQAIPTLQPGLAWELDPVLGEHVYATKYPEEQAKTKKTVRFQVLVPATDKHPAQVEKWNEDVPIGKYTIRRWSGMLSPGEKSELLGRLDILSQAVKQARQRANCQEVKVQNIGKKLIDFLMQK